MAYCISCKVKTKWAKVPRQRTLKNNVIMLQGICAKCGKNKSTIVSQFKKKAKKAKKKSTYKQKRTGHKSTKQITKKRGGFIPMAGLKTDCFGRRNMYIIPKTKKKRGGFIGTAASLAAQGIYEGLNALAKSGLGGQGGKSAGNKARRARFGWPPRGHY